MATERFTQKPQQNFVSGGDRVASHALYIATVKATADNERMGRIRVFVNAFDGDQNDSNTWITVRYLTPFYGVTPSELAVPGSNDWSKTQKSYGMWMPPPDIGTKCAVMFEEGDLSRGYVIGYPMDLYMNNMIPGNPSSRLKNIDEDSDDYDSELLEQKIANVPVTEYNKASDVTTPDTTRKPVHPFVDTLITQGLANDNVRGNTSSSARRESPSQVFGISTPGPIDFTGQISKDPTVGNFHGAIQDKDGKVIKRANSRQGGHTFVMDDGTPQENINNEIVGNKTNELIRLRTRTGHQMVMHDTEGLIYIGSASGKTWLEFTKDGKIDIFAEDSVSVHTKNDFNFRADRDVNIEAGRNINMKAVGSMPSEANAFHDKQLDSVSTGAIRMESKAETHVKVGGEGRIEVTNDFKMESVQGNVDIRASQVAETVDDVVRPRKDVRIHATGDVDLLSGNSANKDDGLTSNINLQAVTDADSVKGNFNLKTSGKFNIDSVEDTSLKSTAKLQVSNAGTDIDGGTINFNSGTVSITTAGASATAEQATINAMMTHKMQETDTQFVFPYRTDARSVTAQGKTLQLESIMKRVPVHEEWPLHEDKARSFVTPDRTDREYLEPINDKKAGNDLSTRT
jgi:hypothetical protein